MTIQARLTVGPPGDRYERQADRIADAIVAAPEPRAQRQPVEREEEQAVLQGKPVAEQILPLGAAGEVRRLCAGCEEEQGDRKGKHKTVAPSGEEEDEKQKTVAPGGEEEDEKQKTVAAAGAQGEAPAARHGDAIDAGHSIERRVLASRGRGERLAEAPRSFMEQRFGADFGDIHVHHDEESDRLGRALSAQAFTVGSDLFFRRGTYEPTSREGRHLLAHELTHTLQQSAPGASRRRMQRKIGDGHDLSSALLSGNTVLEAVFDNERLLRRGSSGNAVGLLQQALVNLTYPLPRFGVDNRFGPETEAAVRAFQTDTGATVDGIVGPQTIGFLDSRLQGQPVVAPPAPVIGAALPAANVIVQPGAAPVNGGPLTGSTYGLTDTETVTVDFVAVRSGPNWVPVVTGLTGNYSLQFRLLPGQAEVTGPGGNTTAANFCAQVTELNALGNPAATATWYMLSAVLAHERVHATRLRPALLTSAPAIEASIEALSVPHAAGMDAAAAATAIRALPAFTAAVANARTVWDAAYVALITGDHAAGGPTDTAEHGIVDPMVRRICAHARANRFGPCSPPC